MVSMSPTAARSVVGTSWIARLRAGRPPQALRAGRRRIARDEWKLSEPPRRIAALPALRHSAAGVGGHVGPRFVDDADDAERHPHPRDARPLGRVPSRHDAAPTGSGRAATSSSPWAIASMRVGIERQPVEQRAGDAGPLAAASPRRWRPGSRRLVADRRAAAVSAGSSAPVVAVASARRPPPAPPRRWRQHGRDAGRSSVAVSGMARYPVQHQVVAVDHLVAATIAEQASISRLLWPAIGARPRPNRRRGRVPSLAAVSGRARPPRRRARTALDADDAGRQQALAAAQRRDGAGVDHERAARLQGAGDPALARRRGFAVGRNQVQRVAVLSAAARAAACRRRSPCGSRRGSRSWRRRAWSPCRRSE